MNRGALDFLQTYGEDELSEDDVVPGPKVSTKRAHRSDSDDEDHVTKLPVPALFRSNKLKESQLSDQNEQNNGRVRSFPHERGNWATYLYVPYTSNAGLDNLIETIKSNLQDIADIQTVDHFHISLSRTVVLKYHWIDSFVSTVQTKLKGIKRFLVLFDCLQIYCNDEETRTFIGMQIKTGHDSLLKLSNSLDDCLKEYRLETYYKDASFHMSIAWCLGNKTNELKPHLPAMNDIFRNICSNTDDTSWYIDVNAIDCKTGNKLFTFAF